MPLEQGLNIQKEVLSLLDEILILNGRSADFTVKTPLLGAIPELDSMAVVALITGLEKRFGFAVGDDEIEGTTFATVGSLIDFVAGKLAG
jgi:acyl carrier protein